MQLTRFLLLISTFLAVYSLLGVFFLLGTAYLVPKRLRTLEGEFLAGSAMALIFIWPIPATIGIIRLLTYPARKLSEKRVKEIEAQW